MRRVLACVSMVALGCGREADDNGRITQIGPEEDATLETSALPDAASASDDGADAGPFHTRWLIEGDSLDLGFEDQVAIDDSGNVYMLASYLGDAHLAGESLPRDSNIALVVKRQSDGSRAWTTPIPSRLTTFGAPAAELLWLAVDGDARAYVTGWEWTPDDAGGFDLDEFLVAVSQEGTLAWRKNIPGIDGPIAGLRRGVAVFGIFDGTVDFGDGPRTSATPTPYVAAFGSDGSLSWLHPFPPLPDKSVLSDPMSPRSIVVGADGRIYVSGNFHGTIDLGSGPLTATHTYDRFVAALEPDGTFRWAMRLDGLNTGDPPRVSDSPPIRIDGVGHVYVGGAFSGDITIGTTTLTSAGGDFFVASFTADGVAIKAIQIGASGLPLTKYARFAVDRSGSVVVAGSLDGPAFEYDAGPEYDGSVSVEAEQFALLRYTPDLAIDWQWTSPRPTPTAAHPFFASGAVAFPPTDAAELAIIGDFTDTFTVGEASVRDPSADPLAYAVFVGTLILDR